MKLGLLGSQISYSLSPVIHQFLLSEHQIDGEYTCIDISPTDFGKETIAQLSTYKGLNVTIPYKEKIQSFYQDAIYSKEAQSIQAVNCIHYEKDHITFHNTDAYGFIQPLLEHTHHRQKKALILGNGGAMKAVKYALENEYPQMEMHIVGRNKHHEEEILYSDIQKLCLSEYGLIVNTTPINPYQFSKLNNNTILYDLNYRNEKCQFLFDHPNTIHINGIAMLVYQAIRSFEIWNGCQVSNKIIQKLFKEIEVQYGIKQ